MFIYRYIEQIFVFLLWFIENKHSIHTNTHIIPRCSQSVKLVSFHENLSKRIHKFILIVSKIEGAKDNFPVQIRMQCPIYFRRRVKVRFHLGNVFKLLVANNIVLRHWLRVFIVCCWFVDTLNMLNKCKRSFSIEKKIGKTTSRT